MTAIASHTNPALVDHAPLNADDLAPTNQLGGNSVSESGQAQHSSPSSPTDGGREATNGPLTYEETERLTGERLAGNSDYQALSVKLDTWKDLENDFATIDAHTGFPFGTGDGIVTLQDLRALSDDPFADPDAKAAANRLLSHMSIWNELAKGDNKVGTHDVTDFLNAQRAQLAGMKNEARAQITAEHAQAQTAAGVGAAGATPATGGTPATGAPAAGTPAATAAGTPAETPEEAKKKADAKALMEEAGKALPKPPPSQFSGMEGASENMNNMIGWAEAETDRLTTLMGKTDDPAVLKQLETKINQMSRRMQQMTALMNQLMTAMQNISKMYSDIAMNSVRNMR